MIKKILNLILFIIFFIYQTSSFSKIDDDNNFNHKLSASHNIARNYLNEGYWNQDNKQLKLHDKCCLENLEFAKKIKDENVGSIYSNLAKS